MIAKCACQRCGNPIEFEIEHNGTGIDCPHCGQRTVLEASPKKTVTVKVKPPASVPQPAPSRIENRLDSAAYALFGLFVLGGVVCIVGGIVTAAAGMAGEAFFVIPLFVGVATIVQGYIIKILFQGFAEAIRLLRRIAVGQVDQMVQAAESNR